MRPQKQPQVRGADLKFHAVDPKTGAPLCGLVARKVLAPLPMPFKPGHQRSCPTCVARVDAKR